MTANGEVRRALYTRAVGRQTRIVVRLYVVCFFREASTLEALRVFCTGVGVGVGVVAAGGVNGASLKYSNGPLEIRNKMRAKSRSDSGLLWPPDNRPTLNQYGPSDDDDEDDEDEDEDEDEMKEEECHYLLGPTASFSSLQHSQADLQDLWWADVHASCLRIHSYELSTTAFSLDACAFQDVACKDGASLAWSRRRRRGTPGSSTQPQLLGAQC